MRESLLLRPRAPLQWRWRGHWRRGGTSPGSAGAERSGAAGRWAGARGAPRSAAVQGADREGRPVALSRVLTQAARPVTARGTDWSPPRPFPWQGCLPSGARSPHPFFPSAGLLYWPTPPAHPHGVQKKREKKTALTARTGKMCNVNALGVYVWETIVFFR